MACWPRMHTPPHVDRRVRSKVSIDERAEGGPFILPREVVNAPGTDHQVADQSDESRPSRGSRGRRSPATLLSNKAQIRAAHAK
eukprot:15480557-Alexandrium_andersonii.AAC.1